MYQLFASAFCLSRVAPLSLQVIVAVTCALHPLPASYSSRCMRPVAPPTRTPLRHPSSPPCLRFFRRLFAQALCVTGKPIGIPKKEFPSDEEVDK